METKKKKNKLSRLQFFALFAIATYIAVAGLSYRGILDDWKLQWWDGLITTFEKRDPPKDVLLLSVDTRDLATVGPWPWDRRKLAKAVDFLTDSGATVIAFDIFFRKEQPAEDGIFIKSLNRHGRVVIAQPWDTAKSKPEAPPPSFHKAKVYFGHVARTETRVFRQMNLFIVDAFDFDRSKNISDNYYIPSLSLLAARLHRSIEKEPISLEGIPFGPVIASGSLKIPVFSTGVDAAGIPSHMIINFSGGPGSFQEHGQSYPLAPLVIDKPSEHYLALKKEIGGKAKGAIVLIYNTFDPNDQFNTPYTPMALKKGSEMAETMPGGEIHAQSLCTILAQRFIRYYPVVDYAFPVLFLLLGATLVSIPISWKLRLLFFPLLCLLWVGVSVMLFAHLKIVTNLAFPLICLVILAGGLIYYERSQFISLFGEFVSHRLKDEILKDASRGGVGTKEVEATIVFADIRGFSTFSEKLAPGELTERMTEYHTAMNRIFERNRGEILDYLGDAEMVGFGILGEDRDHGLMAIKSGLEMQDEIAKIRKKWNLPGGQQFEVGVGICTGMVAEGVVGSEGVKKQLVSMGDTTNTAARIQALSKDLDSLVTISESTYLKFGRDIIADPLKEMPLKGKTQKVMLYRVRGIKEEALKRLQ
jgi:adenylate cyclase